VEDEEKKNTKNNITAGGRQISFCL